MASCNRICLQILLPKSVLWLPLHYNQVIHKIYYIFNFSFRFDWPLDKFGKWAELEYSGSVYPAFACGSGYILSKEVVKWIALNSKYLHCYQVSTIV